MKSGIKQFCTAIALSLVTMGGGFAEQKPVYEQKKNSGFEMGVGVPLVTPLTGYNVFVGYANKDASTFLGRRFGVRADFTISTPLQAKATLLDYEANKYKLDADPSILGYKFNIYNYVKKPVTFEISKNEEEALFDNLDKVAEASFALKNSNMGLLIDFYPFADTWFLGGMRLTGGYYIGELDLDLNVKINKEIGAEVRVSTEKQTTIVDGQPVSSYKSNDWVRVQMPKGNKLGVNYHWNYSGPYAGIGFDLGIYRGFKFFLDAGVVFAHAPHISDDNIKDEDFVVNACYKINGQDCANMIEILHGVKTEPSTDDLFQKTLGYVAQTILTDRESDFADVWTSIGVAPDEIDYMTLGADVVNFLNGTGQADWITDLIDNHPSEGLTKALDAAKEGFYQAKEGEKTIQEEIKKAWNEYNDKKSNAYKDVNKILDDYGMIPMVKIGFMYRF